MPAQRPSSASPSTEHELRKNARYITGLDAQGNHILLASLDLKYHDRGGYAITSLYQLEKIPTDIRGNRDLQHYRASEGYDQGDPNGNPKPFQLIIPGGANFMQGDFGPSSYSAWHRTISVDFVTVVEGELVLLLGENDDNCTRLHLKQGDSVIQRATLHKWLNPSSEKPARFVATLLASEPFKVGEKVAQPIWIPKL